MAVTSIGHLQDEVLGHIFTKLDLPTLLGTVCHVCKAWHRATLKCPDLWASAEFILALDAAGVARLERYRDWMARRAGHVKRFHFCSMGTGLPELETAPQKQAWDLLQQVLSDLAPSLQTLDLQWFGKLDSMDWVTPLRSLLSLELDAHAVVLDAPLAQLTQVTRLAVYTLEGTLSLQESEEGELLPASLQFLSVLHATPLHLPPSLARLPALQRLFMSECSLEGPGFPGPLLQATSLQHLAIHCCQLPHLPAELSRLSNLRALLLDSNMHPQDEEALGELLEPLTKLEILGLSKCKLRALPRSVCGLTALQCLYTEENRLAEIPDGPFLQSIRLLSLDWRTLLGGCGPRLLQGAIALRQLYICRAFPFLPPPGDRSRTWALSEVTAAMHDHPSLRRVVFVLYESERLSQQVEVAEMMLALGRSCPCLDLAVIRYDHFFALNLDSLDVELA